MNRKNRSVVKVRLDHTGIPRVVQGDRPVEVDEQRAREAAGDPELPIVIYVKQGDDQVGEIETAPDTQKQAIADALSRHDEVDTVEFPVGETGEPAVADVTAGIEAASELGLSVQLRLPR